MPNNWKKEAEIKPQTFSRLKRKSTIFRGTHLYIFGFLFSVLVLFGIGIFVVVEENNISFSLNGDIVEVTPTVIVVEVTPTVTPSLKPVVTNSQQSGSTITDNFNVILSKEIDNEVYAYIEVEYDNYKDHMFGTLSGESQNKFTPYNIGASIRGNLILSLFSDQTYDFWLDEEINKLFLVNALTNQGLSHQVGVFQIDLPEPESDSIETSWTMIMSGNPGLYSVNSFIDFDQDRLTFIMETKGGDSCAGWGSVWTLDLAGVVQDVSETAVGCGDILSPRFAGIIDSQLLFIEVTDENTPPVDGIPEYIVKRIYTIDPWSLEETTLRDIDTRELQLAFYDKTWLTHYDSDPLSETETPFKELTPDSNGMYHYQAYDINTDTFRNLDYTSEY